MPANGVTRAGQASRAGVTSLGHLLVLGLMNFPLLRALALPLSAGAKEDAPDGKSPDDPTLWIYLAVAFGLVIGGGIFAGLTIA
jgi:metal transporter CNNM